jgi:hypothetical protein
VANQQFSTADAFNDRRGLGTEAEAPVSGATITKSVRFPMELWTPFEAELRARGLDASNGIRMICAEWLRREQRR